MDTSPPHLIERETLGYPRQHKCGFKPRKPSSKDCILVGSEQQAVPLLAQFLSGLRDCSYQESTTGTKWHCVYTVDPEQHGFELQGSSYTWVFFNIQSTFCIPEFHIHEIRYIRSTAGNQWTWRANCMHCSTSSYRRGLNILRLWYPLSYWNQSPPAPPRARDDYN